jgi:hypothetical protein
MSSIKVTGDQTEYPDVTEYYHCTICGNDNVKMMTFENYCGYNWISCCFKCLCEIMDKEEIKIN